MTDRLTVDTINSDQLDALYDRAEQAEESARRALEQRQEMAEERYAWQERGLKAEAERDGAYRERAHLLAWLATLHAPNAVLAPALDIDDEDGWHLLFLTVAGRQMSWHIAPADVELFNHVERVDFADPRAQWDGHTTDEKYQRIRTLPWGEMRDAVRTPGPAEAAIARVRLIKKAPSRSPYNTHSNAQDDGWDQALDAVQEALGAPERCVPKSAGREHPVHELIKALKESTQPGALGLVGRYYDAIHDGCCPYEHSPLRPGYAAAANRAALRAGDPLPADVATKARAAGTRPVLASPSRSPPRRSGRPRSPASSTRTANRCAPARTANAAPTAAKDRGVTHAHRPPHVRAGPRRQRAAGPRRPVRPPGPRRLRGTRRARRRSPPALGLSQGTTDPPRLSKEHRSERQRTCRGPSHLRDRDRDHPHLGLDEAQVPALSTTKGRAPHVWPDRRTPPGGPTVSPHAPQEPRR